MILSTQNQIKKNDETRLVFEFCPICENPVWDGKILWNEVDFYDVTTHSIYPTYCPKCGRKLKEE